MGREKMNIKPGKYRHYKGTECAVLGVAKHSETLEDLVVYEHPSKETGEMELWVRPLAMFQETITVNGKTTPRFEYIEE